MVIDTGMAAIFITILIALLGLAVAWGTLHERVKNIRYDMTQDRKETKEDIIKIFDSIDKIRETLSKGR